MPNPYAAAIDALSGSITPENALRVIGYVEGLPDLIEAIADRFTRDGIAYRDDFPSHPQAGEAAVAIGVMMGRFQDPVADFGATFRRVHERDLRRLREPRHQEHKWDSRLNRE